MQLLISPGGTVRCVYDEAFDLRKLGKPNIERGSHVEPTASGQWTADLSPVDGPVLGPFDHRTAALAAEQQWLETHWLLSEP
jgi:hypothetical protein